MTGGMAFEKYLKSTFLKGHVSADTRQHPILSTKNDRWGNLFPIQLAD